MPAPSAISNQTAIRSGANFTRYAIVHTPDVVCQVQPSEDASALTNAHIPVGTPSVGSLSAIKADYTVLITPSSDYKNDLQYRADDCYITYARLDAGGAYVYIGNTAYQWTTSHYVTALKELRVFQRQIRLDDSRVQYRDYDRLYSKPKPRIYDLYSEALEIASGDSTVSKSFTPSAESMYPSGTISSWFWDVDGNTISTGTSSSQNITVDFTAGTHIVRLTVTDSNGVSNKLSILIAVIPADYNSVIADGMTVVSLDHSEEGHVGAINTVSDIEPYLSGSMAMVCTKVHYANGSSELITDMVGWLGEVSLATLGSDLYGRLMFADIAILDVAFKMASIQIRQYPFVLNSSPTEWGQYARVTPLDIAWHILSEMTTVSNLCAIHFPSDYDEQKAKSVDSPSGSLTDILNTLAFLNNTRALEFWANGETAIVPSLPYASTTVRDNATTLVTLSTEDCDIEPRYPSVGDLAIQYVNAGGLFLDTNSNETRRFYGRAPALAETGVLEENIIGMVFPEDSDPSGELVGRLSFNHWDAANENLTLDISNALGGYLKVRQSQGVWVKLSVDAGELLNSDLTYGSGLRFICNSVSQAYDAENGSLTVSMSLRKETGNKDLYSIISQELFNSLLEANLPVMPNVPIYPMITESDATDVYGDEYEDSTSGMPDPSESPSSQENVNTPSAIIETISIPLSGQTVTTTNSFPSGKTYLVTFSGSGKVSDTWEHIIDLTESNGGFYAASTGYAADGRYADYSSGNGWTSSSIDGFEHVVSIRLDITSSVVTSIGLGANPRPLYQFGASLLSGGSTTPLGNEGDAIYILGTESAQNVSSGGDEYEGYITRVTLKGKGENPFGGDTESGNGDAFFFMGNETPIAWGGAGGVELNGGNIALASVNPSSFNPSHQYQLIATGTDDTWDFNFVDTDGSYTENSGSITVTIREIVT